MLELIGLALGLVVGVAALGAFLYKNHSDDDDNYALRAIRKDGRVVTWQDEDEGWGR